MFRHYIALVAFFFSLMGPSGRVTGQTVPSGFNDALVMAGFDAPVGFTFDANGRMYVWEKGGKVWIVENGARLPSPLVDISAEVGNWRDHGCLGFALDPNFLSNGRIYLYYLVDRHHLLHFGTPSYSASTNEYFNATIMRCTRYTAIGPSFNTTDPASRFVLLGETKKTGIPLLFESHSTGSLVFGTDGTLMLSSGDAASYNSADVGNDPATYYAQALTDSILRPSENVGSYRSQLVDCLNGKVLRIDPETGNGVPSNPFYDASAPRSPHSRVWAMGLRNPYRMNLRPGSGSTDPTAGNPGALYIGDVGWSSYEELNICTEGGMNFGWPKFEGMEENGPYLFALAQNPEAPNPLYDGAGCAKPYFDFQDILFQEELVHPPTRPNPCEPSIPIPPNVRTFSQTRPAVDWVHGYQSRTGGFVGNTPVVYDLDDPASPVPGPRFGGNASVGGTFITGAGWPAGYQNTYFNGDYAGAWIRRFKVSPDNKVQQVYDFGSNMGAVVFLKEGPDGALWYVRYEAGAIRKVSPLGVTNLPPVAAAQQDIVYGAAPLAVQFTGSGSTDPENMPLTYLWDFGDGQTSTLPDPAHSFNAVPGTPTTYTVTLTVKDSQLQTNSTTLIVSVNNTPPVVAITSFPDGQYYPVGIDTAFSLEAVVSDAEHGPSQLTYTWQTTLHHNNHTHAEPLDHGVASTTVISGVGCYEEDFWYSESLKVTDSGGLSTTVTHSLYPNCGVIPPTAVITASAAAGLGSFISTLDGTGSVDNGTIVDYTWDFGDGTYAYGASVQKTFNELGDYHVRLTVTDNDGLSSWVEKVITVYDLSPPQCPGIVGSVLREFWTGISGTTVASLTGSPNYPDQPSGTTYPTSIRGPVNYDNNYGTRMRGYIIAPSTGTFTFNTTSDDNSIFYLSPNADPALKQPLCTVAGYTGDTETGKYPTQQSGPVTLQAGVWYYFEFLQKDGSGGDNMTLRWTQPGNTVLTEVGAPNIARWVDCAPNMSLRVALDGPFDSATGLMHDDLRALSLLPTTEPYTAMGFAQLGGGGGETLSPAMLSVTGKNAIVDWVLVELRSKNNSSQLVATRCALLQRDGDVVGVDGHSRLVFNVPADRYFVVVRHRNHLAAMTSNTMDVNKYGGNVDFTAAILGTYGSYARKSVAGERMALWPGNASPDAMLMYTGAGNDRDAVLGRVGGTLPTATVTGYWAEDVNMDGVVSYTGANNDRDPILVNIGGTEPNNVRTQQLP